MQGRLDELSQEIDSVELVSLSSFVVEETVVKENEITAQEKDASVIIQSPKPVIEAAEEEEPVNEEAPVIIKKEEPKNAVLGESIKLAAGLRHSISLNDSFRFSRELFKGDTDLMNRVIEQISVMGSYKTAVAFLSSKVEIDEEKDAVVDFLELLKKYFNQSA